MAAFTLRPDQLALIQQIETSLAAGEVPCTVAPTGAGKTVLLAETARRALARGERVVALAHRGEIIGQIVASIKRHLGDATHVEAITAGWAGTYSAPVTVAMVPSLHRRIRHLAPLHGCTVLADEAHHVGSKTWAETIDALLPGRMVGFTATPIRPDGQGMGDTGRFHRLILGPQPAELMEIGALCRYRLFGAPRMIDSKGLKRRGGDFAVGAEMKERVIEINGEIIPDWRRFNPDGLRTIFVSVSVEHAHTVAAMFSAADIPAAAVDGKTPRVQRAELFAAFRAGSIRVLCACALIDEGLDVPEATCLQLTRPTASLRLYRQLVGRVLRPAPGKTEALIIDHTDNYRRLPLPDAAIDWQLYQEEVAEVNPRQVVVNSETNEVTTTDGEPPEIVASGLRLEEIRSRQLDAEINDAEALYKATPQRIRKLVNHKLAQLLAVYNNRLIVAGTESPELSEYLRYDSRLIVAGTEFPELSGYLRADIVPILEPDNIKGLTLVMGLTQGWADSQLLINEVQQNASLLAATRQAQARLISQAS